MNRKTKNWRGKRPFPFILLLFILPALACQFGQQAETATNTEAENGQIAIATTIAKLVPPTTDENPSENTVGETRANPLPPGTIIEEGQWTIEVLETNRGEPAWQAIHRVNANNPLPPEGWEYFNVKMRLKNNEPSPEERSLYSSVTGDNRIQYASYDSGVVSPEPPLDTYLPGLAESEGWQSFLIHKNEGNLIFVFEGLGDYSAPPKYLAVEPGSTIPVAEEMMQNITRTEFGTTQDQPVPYGQTATGEDWQIIVQDVLMGDAAWSKILEENQFNEPPEAGMQYIMVKLRTRYIGFNEHGQPISDSYFSTLTSSGTEFEVPSLVDPEPNLAYSLYPGGEAEGWIVLTAPHEAKDLTLFFSPDNSRANDRYLSLGQGR